MSRRTSPRPLALLKCAVHQPAQAHGKPIVLPARAARLPPAAGDDLGRVNAAAQCR
jgi:hypothetical protein